MLSNARGADVIAGTVVPATFRGAPIVACSSDYTDTFQATAWTNLVAAAATLDAPAIHVDVAHDGGAAPLLAALANLQSLYVPGFVAPWVNGDLAQIPICGPLFYFDGDSPNPSTDSPGTGGHLAVQVAQASINFRRNNLYGMGNEGVWPNLDDQVLYGDDALDLIPRPPIHLLWTNMGVASPNWFLIATLPQWRAYQGSRPVKDVLAEGYAELASRAATYPGIERRVNPYYIIRGLFVFPWNV